MSIWGSHFWDRYLWERTESITRKAEANDPSAVSNSLTVNCQALRVYREINLLSHLRCSSSRDFFPMLCSQVCFLRHMEGCGTAGLESACGEQAWRAHVESRPLDEARLLRTDAHSSCARFADCTFQHRLGVASEALSIY